MAEQEEQISFTPTKSRFWRLIITQFYPGAPFLKLAEIYVFGYPNIQGEARPAKHRRQQRNLAKKTEPCSVIDLGGLEHGQGASAMGSYVRRSRDWAKRPSYFNAKTHTYLYFLRSMRSCKFTEKRKS